MTYRGNFVLVTYGQPTVTTAYNWFITVGSAWHQVVGVLLYTGGAWHSIGNTAVFTNGNWRYPP